MSTPASHATGPGEAAPEVLPLPPGPGPLRRAYYLLRFGLGGDKDALIDELLTLYGPVTRLRPYILIWGPQANRLVTAAGSDRLVNWENPEFPSLASMDGPVHLTQRKAVMQAFLPRQLAGYVPLMREAIEQRCASWSGRDLDLHQEMSALAMETLLRTMLGVLPGTPEHERFAAAYWPLIHRADGLLPFVRRAATARAKREMWTLLRELVLLRRASPGQDALSTLVAASDAGRPTQLSDDELVRYAHMLMDFGQGDIAIYLTYLVALLATRPDLRVQLAAEQPAVSEEALLALESRLPSTYRMLLETERLYPPVTELHRTLVADVAFSGYRLPKGYHLVSSLRFTCRSAQHFPRPRQFEPERFSPPRSEHAVPFTLMGFGAGRHMCVATAFCRLHAAVVLHALLGRFELTKLGSPELPEVSYRQALQRPVEPIFLRAAVLASAPHLRADAP